MTINPAVANPLARSFIEYDLDGPLPRILGEMISIVYDLDDQGLAVHGCELWEYDSEPGLWDVTVHTDEADLQ